MMKKVNISIIPEISAIHFLPYNKLNNALVTSVGTGTQNCGEMF